MGFITHICSVMVEDEMDEYRRKCKLRLKTTGRLYISKSGYQWHGKTQFEFQRMEMRKWISPWKSDGHLKDRQVISDSPKSTNTANIKGKKNNIRQASRKALNVSSFRIVADSTNFFTPCDENKCDIASVRSGMIDLSYVCHIS